MAGSIYRAASVSGKWRRVARGPSRVLPVRRLSKFQTTGAFQDVRQTARMRLYSHRKFGGICPRGAPATLLVPTRSPDRNSLVAVNLAACVLRLAKGKIKSAKAFAKITRARSRKVRRI